MYLERLTLEILRLVAEEDPKRIISLDLETGAEEGMLRDEYILGVVIARRIAGELTSPEGIEVETFLLEQEQEEAEIKLLNEVNGWMKKNNIRPLAIVGYSHRGYDIPLLAAKKQKYRHRFGEIPWRLVDLVEQAAHIDLHHPLKHKPYEAKTLEAALNHTEFSHLTFKRQKHLVPSRGEEKAKAIHRLWRENQAQFKEYMEGDAVNPLLIAEHLIKTKSYYI